MWSTGEGNGKPLQYSCLESPMNSMKRQNDRILKEEHPRSVGAKYATGDQWRNNSRKNEGIEPKQKQYLVVDVTVVDVTAVATGLEKVSFDSNLKERQCKRMLKLLHNCTHLTC